MRSSTTTEKFTKGELMKKVVIAIGAGLLIGSAITMPGLLIALKPFLKKRQVSQSSLWKTYKILARRKLVTVKEVDGKYILETTEEGKKQQKEYELQEMMEGLRIPFPKKWDRKWRLVVFDIPEKKKRAREALRGLLKYLTFYRLQDSVFIHPFECEKEVDLLTNTFEIQQYIYYFTITEQKVPPRVAYQFAKLLSQYQE
ncbi:MAG: CRISPR-associated endonuclease Cas2 [Patescibacteria group bacterium]